MVVDEYPGDSRILMIDQCSDKVATPLLQFMLGAVKAEMKETQALLMSMVGNACPSEFFGKSQNNTCIFLVKLSHSRKTEGGKCQSFRKAESVKRDTSFQFRCCRLRRAESSHPLGKYTAEKCSACGSLGADSWEHSPCGPEVVAFFALLKWWVEEDLGKISCARHTGFAKLLSGCEAGSSDCSQPGSTLE
jgi:hypothetical protein